MPGDTDDVSDVVPRTEGVSGFGPGGGGGSRSTTGWGDLVRYRNGAHGYGLVTKALHWLTVAAILGQFLVGYAMDFGEGAERQEDLAREEADRQEDEAAR